MQAILSRENEIKEKKELDESEEHTGLPEIGIMCPSGKPCLPVGCCFSELVLKTSN